MITNPKYVKIQKYGKYSHCVLLTEQLKALNINKGDKVYACVEEIGGKKRIIIEGVK